MEMIAAVLVLVCIPIMLIMWTSKKEQIGTIRCRRCKHVGPAKGLWVPFKGIKPVCQRCDSEDWVTVDKK